MREIYLDNSATTCALPEVVDVIRECLTCKYGNPSSLHQKGLEAEKILRYARSTVAESICAKEKNIVFTASGTEANNLAIQGIARAYVRAGKHLITTSIEHPSVLNTFKALEEEGFDASYLNVNSEGVIDIEDLKAAIRKDTILVSIMYVNNEVGSILPVINIGDILKKSGHKIYFHVDAVQAYGKLPMADLMEYADLVTLSAHKIHGPKGIAALYVSDGTRLKAIIHGGGQERGLRSGTENVPGAAGFAAAIKAINEGDALHLKDLKSMLAKGITDALPNAVINGPIPEEGAPHILNVSFKGIRGEVLLHALEREGIYVSTGSACSSKRQKVSHVLKAMNLSNALCESAIRFSLSVFNDEEDIKYTVDVLKRIVPELMRFSGR